MVGSQRFGWHIILLPQRHEVFFVIFLISKLIYHIRETRWDLPQGEELIMQPAPQQAAQPLVQDPRIIAHQNQQQQQQQHTTTIVCDTLQRRTEFKRQVSALVAKCIEAYRKRFFPNTNDYTNFLRKVSILIHLKHVKSLQIFADHTQSFG